MLPLRRNVQYNKRCFFKDIFLFVCGAHGILLALLFVCDKGKFHQEKFTINTDNLHTTVVFMPLQKRVAVPVEPSVQPQHKKEVARQVLSYDAYEKKLAQKTEKQQKQVPDKKVVAPKKIVQQKPQKTQSVVTATKQIKPTTIINAETKKKNLIAATKEVVVPVKKTVTQVVKPEVKKNPEKKEVVQKEEQVSVIAEQKVPEKVVQEKSIESQKIEQPEPVVEEKTINEVLPVVESSEDVLDLENVSFIGSRDLEMMVVKEQIYAQVAKYYKPPVGISKKAVCELTVRVGVDGKAEQVIIKKSSGSRANDMCARAALLQVKFPKEVISKEIIVELGQS